MQAICQCCNNEFTFSKQGKRTGKYCSLQCTKDGQRKERMQKFLNGEVVGRGHLRRYMVEIHGWKCMCCKNETWMDQLIPLELDHVDGNAGNNKPENLKLLCPNCHAQTPTHKAKNKGNGRGSRGLPWY